MWHVTDRNINSAQAMFPNGVLTPASSSQICPLLGRGSSVSAHSRVADKKRVTVTGSRVSRRRCCCRTDLQRAWVQERLQRQLVPNVPTVWGWPFAVQSLGPLERSKLDMVHAHRCSSVGPVRAFWSVSPCRACGMLCFTEPPGVD